MAVFVGLAGALQQANLQTRAALVSDLGMAHLPALLLLEVSVCDAY